MTQRLAYSTRYSGVERPLNDGRKKVESCVSEFLSNRVSTGVDRYGSRNFLREPQRRFGRFVLTNKSATW